MSRGRTPAMAKDREAFKAPHGTLTNLLRGGPTKHRGSTNHVNNNISSSSEFVMRPKVLYIAHSR
eukprot:1655408-Heterocapsa_arctica.AAC.1